MAAARHVPELVDDAVEEVLLRCPPDDPSRLLRAALACRRWRRLASTPGFRRRYGERHRAPPALGFICNLAGVEAHFVPDTALSSSSRRPRTAAALRLRMRALDARHGRVLLHDVSGSTCWTRLSVWNPITGEWQDVIELRVVLEQPGWSAAVLCAAAGRGGCDHVGCHRGGFRVVVVGINPPQAYTYSSEPGCVWTRLSTRAAGGAAFSQKPGCYFDEPHPSALVGNVLHFVLRTEEGASRILKYDLGTEQMSLMNLPQTESMCPRIVLTTMEDGGLGVAIVGESKLHLWSKVDGLDSGAEWYESRVIDLKILLPADALSASPGAVGFAGGVGVIFLGTKVGNFLVDLKSNQAVKLGDGRGFHSVLPCTNFCFPRLQPRTPLLEDGASAPCHLGKRSRKGRDAGRRRTRRG